MEEDDNSHNISTYWNDWGYGYYDEEPEQERIEQPYLNSMYRPAFDF